MRRLVWWSIIVAVAYRAGHRQGFLEGGMYGISRMTSATLRGGLHP